VLGFWVEFGLRFGGGEGGCGQLWFFFGGGGK